MCVCVGQPPSSSATHMSLSSLSFASPLLRTAGLLVPPDHLPAAGASELGNVARVSSFCVDCIALTQDTARGVLVRVYVCECVQACVRVSVSVCVEGGRTQRSLAVACSLEDLATSPHSHSSKRDQPTHQNAIPDTCICDNVVVVVVVVAVVYFQRSSRSNRAHQEEGDIVCAMLECGL